MTKELMSKEETDRLDVLEAVIIEDLKGFIRVGMALKEIRGNKLYRAKYTTWKGYLKDEWDLTKTHANFQINAFNVIENLKQNDNNCCQNENDEPFNLFLPHNEAQARPLTLLAPAQQISAWEKVLRQTDGKVTALAVNKVVQEVLEGQLTEEKNLLKNNITKEVTIPTDFSEQFSKLIEIMDLYRKSGWKDFNRKKAIEFVQNIETYLKS